jgi:hypothetical protein
MLEANKQLRSSALWLGFAAALAALLCNFAFFLNPPVRGALPWLSLVLAVVGLVLIALGAKRLFAQPRGIAARIFGTLVIAFTLLLSGASIFGFFHARALPPSTDAPHVGEKAPDFTLPDTHGQRVSLTQLFAPSPGDGASAAPRGVLLVFYRGYW